MHKHNESVETNQPLTLKPQPNPEFEPLKGGAHYKETHVKYLLRPTEYRLVWAVVC